MSLTFTVTESLAAAAPRELWRKNGSTLELQRVQFDEDGYTTPDAKRYRLILSGMSDTFEEDGIYGLQTKVIAEFTIVGSKKWEGTRFSSFYTVPKDWTNEKARLAELGSALNGRPLVKGDQVDFTAHILKETVFEGVVEIASSNSGREYAKIRTHLPLDDDDRAPVQQGAVTTDDAFPE